MKHLFATIFTALAVVALVAPCGEAKGRKHNVKKQHKKTAVKRGGLKELNVVPYAERSGENVKVTDVLPNDVESEFGTLDMLKHETKIEEVKKIEEPMPVNSRDENRVLNTCEQPPAFPGGDEAIVEFLNSHIRYPQAAQENGIQGRCIVQFVVERDGTVGEVKVARSAGDRSLDFEAVRVVKTFPAFIPGRQAGKLVRCWYTLPVTFKLDF